MQINKIPDVIEAYEGWDYDPSPDLDPIDDTSRSIVLQSVPSYFADVTKKYKPISEFHLPAPPASAKYDLPNHLLKDGMNENIVLSSVANRIERAIISIEYPKYSYFPVSCGFALVTHIEKIDDNGAPISPRWEDRLRPLNWSNFSLNNYIKALFYAAPGRYRIIVFVITNKPFSQLGTRVSREEALSWLNAGVNRLPNEIGNMPYTPEHKCTALIYEFKQPGVGEKAVLLDVSKVSGKAHLVKAQILSELSKAQ